MDVSTCNLGWVYAANLGAGPRGIFKIGQQHPIGDDRTLRIMVSET